MKVYFISGLAADGRIFKNVRLPDGFEPVIIDWIKPVKNESLPSYAARLAERIDTNEPFCLIGISLGGIMASEISTQFHSQKTIIIGSVPVIAQLPGYYKWINKIRIQKLVPGQFYKMTAIIKNYYFTPASKEDRKLVVQMVRDSDPAFIRWGIQAVLNWTNQQQPSSLIHIHGTRDEVFPFVYTKPTHIIPKGSHMLLITHLDRINQIIGESLRSL